MNQIARGIARGHCCLPLDFCENLIWLMRPHRGGLTMGEGKNSYQLLLPHANMPQRPVSKRYHTIALTLCQVTAHEPLIPGYALWAGIGLHIQVQLGELTVFHLGRPNVCARRRRWHPIPVLLPGKYHGWRSLVGCSPWGFEESDTTERLHFHFSLSCIGEGNGNPLQCSCLENPRDGGACWAAVYGIAQNRT